MSSFEFLKRKPNFVEDVNDDFKCCICKEALIDARCGPCGCQYCARCIETHLENNDKCPGKSELCDAVNLDMYKDIGINHVANRKIEKMVIECLHAGCEHQCMIKEMEEHARSCDMRIVDCPFMEIGCVRKDVTKGEVRSHIDESGFEHTSMMVGWMGEIKNVLEDTKKDYTHMKQTCRDELAALREELKPPSHEERDGLQEELKHKLHEELASLHEELKKTSHDELASLHEELKKTSHDDLAALKEELKKTSHEELASLHEELKKTSHDDLVALQEELKKTSHEELASLREELKKTSHDDLAALKEELKKTSHEELAALKEENIAKIEG